MVDLSNIMEIEKILLTGASGFAGSHMLKHLYTTSYTNVINLIHKTEHQGNNY